MIFKKGFYCALYKEETYVDGLNDYFNDIINLYKEYGIDMKRNPYNTHITVMCSADCPKGDIDLNEYENKYNHIHLDLNILDFDIFDWNDEYKALVIKIENKLLTQLHEEFKRKYDLEPTYNVYKPHITVGLIKHSDVENSKRINSLIKKQSNLLDTVSDVFRIEFEDFKPNV